MPTALVPATPVTAKLAAASTVGVPAAPVPETPVTSTVTLPTVVTVTDPIEPVR